MSAPLSETISTDGDQPSVALADEPTIARAEAGWRERLDRIFELQRDHRWAMANSGPEQRIARIERISAWVDTHRDEIRAAGRTDFSKPAFEVDLTEIWPVLQEARHAMRHVEEWMRPERVRASPALATTRSWIVPEARGQALVIAPWNYPINLTLIPLISALAAGCCVVLKPSELVPAHSALLRQMIEELFDPSEVALFEGDAEVAQALLERPFEHVFFTGSTSIGRRVMQSAADHLATVTLELGGKSPVVLGDDAQLRDTAAKTVWGKFVNAGQTCIAPDYVLVPRARFDETVRVFSRAIGKAYGATDAARRRSRDLARIVNQRHFDRLEGLLARTRDAGAQVVFGGETDRASRYVAPTLLVDVPLDSPAMQEEIFGPILPLLPYDRLEDALEIIRARPKPLALYVFGSRRFARDVIGKTSAGGTCINDVALHFLHPRLPFGGVNHSGHGASHGRAGFDAFSHRRAVLKHHRWSALKLMAPPYGRLARLLGKATLRFLR
ncbi:MAG: aldehyde dehydrogenase family protein [Acidobacteriota bacterium]